MTATATPTRRGSNPHRQWDADGDSRGQRQRQWHPAGDVVSQWERCSHPDPKWERSSHHDPQWVRGALTQPQQDADREPEQDAAANCDLISPAGRIEG